MNIRIKQGFSWLAAAITSLVLVVVAFLGNYTRFHADDFCTIGKMRQAGFWAAWQYWYLTWDGRFVFTFFSQWFGGAGTGLARLLPAVYIVTWLAGLTWLYAASLKRFTRLILEKPAEHQSRSPWLTGFILAAASLYLVLFTIPNLFQSFLWETGLLNYTTPIIILTYLAAAVISHSDQKRSTSRLNARNIAFLILLTSISILSAGFSETHSVVQIALFMGWGILSVIQARTFTKSPQTIILTLVLAGTITGFVITAAAPGNDVRMELINPDKVSPTPIEIVSNALQYAYITGHAFLKHYWLPAAVLFILAFYLGWETIRKAGLPIQPTSYRLWTSSLWLYLYAMLPLACFGFLVIAMVPAAYVLRDYPDNRALILHHAIIVLSGMFFFTISGMLLRILLRKVNPALEFILVFLILAGLVFTSYQSISSMIESIPYRRDYAARWDSRDARLKQDKIQGNEIVSAAGLEQYYGLHDLVFEPENWINACVAQYYGFKSVSGR